MASDDATPPLREEDLGPDPVAAFARWLGAAERAGVGLPETAVLATATRDGAPSARAVLVKEVDERGFVFFTNYESRKARELAENPQAALVFLWGELGRQVRIEGQVERVAEAESEAYFATRPRGSRLGAWASPRARSSPAARSSSAGWPSSRREYPDDVPLPPFWGGFRLVPSSIEFWQHRDDRLHDRLRYARDGTGQWLVERLSP